ncbi:MAG: hypothetical protein NC543_14945 [bacterium]|nr:hypothetical protein [bacterium]MCM1373455.1 hypothetical protein [Muribaculum sp.]
MRSLLRQKDIVLDWGKRRWKFLLILAEILVLLVAGILYWHQVHSLAHYEYGEEQLRQYTREQYARCFQGEIDESYAAGLYDVIPKEEMFLRKGFYRYSVSYESTSQGSFCWPHTYEDYYNVIEQAVTYLEDGKHQNTEGFWLNADLDVALRFRYSGTGTARVTGFVIEETRALANFQLFFTVMLLLALNLVLALFAYGRKHGISAQSKYVAAGLVTLGLFASYPLLLGYTVSGNDTIFHLARIEGIKDGLLSGQFPVRISPTFYNGYGYANSVFYGETLLYIPALLRLVGFRLTTCYNLYGILINLLTCFGAYYCFNKMFRNSMVAMASTLLYVMAPYRLVNMYLRFAVGEYTGMLFLPFVAYGLFRIYTEDVQSKEYRRCFWPLVLGLSGIIQSHVITGEMTGGLILVVCVLLLFLTVQRKRLWALVKTVLYTLVLNAWFLVPFTDFALTEKIQVMQGGQAARIQSTGLLLPQLLGLFPGYSQLTMNANEGMASEMPLYLGMALVLGMILCAVMLSVAGREMAVRKKQAFFFLALSVLTAWMSTVYFPWDRISTMFPRIPWVASLISTLQFVWRLLALSSVLAAVATGFGLLLLCHKEGKHALATVSVALCLLTGISGMYLMYQCVFYGSSVSKTDLVGEDTAASVMKGEYTLVGADWEVVTEIFEPRVYGSVQIREYEKQGTNISMSVENDGADGYVLLPLLNYKGYHVTSEGGVITDRNLSTGEDAVVRIDVPAGYEGRISVRYRGPWYWRLAEGITVVTLLYLGWKGIGKKCLQNRLKRG